MCVRSHTRCPWGRCSLGATRVAFAEQCRHLGARWMPWRCDAWSVCDVGSKQLLLSHGAAICPGDLCPRRGSWGQRSSTASGVLFVMSQGPLRFGNGLRMSPTAILIDCVCRSMLRCPARVPIIWRRTLTFQNGSVRSSDQLSQMIDHLASWKCLVQSRCVWRALHH